MKPLLKNSDIAGRSIGNWTATQTPDGTIIWTKKKSLLRKKSLTGIYATPHYDKPNIVSIDVVNMNDMNDMNERLILSTTFSLKGEFLASDLKMYLLQLEQIISILK